ncbi:hypothetical protein SD208_15490 [Ochrobactrum sp. BD67]
MQRLISTDRQLWLECDWILSELMVFYGKLIVQGGVFYRVGRKIIIRNMKGRMPWSVAQKVLAECEIHRSMGWDRTLEQIADPKADYSQQTVALTEALREHILCGEKASTFFSLGKDTADRLRSVVKNLTAEKNEFEKAYPFVLDDEELSKQRLPV